MSIFFDYFFQMIDCCHLDVIHAREETPGIIFPGVNICVAEKSDSGRLRGGYFEMEKL